MTDTEVELPDIAEEMPTGIHRKIAAIQREVGAIPKNGQGPQNKGGFAYIKAEDILDKIHQLLVRYNVIVIPDIQYSKHEVVRDGGRGYTNATISVKYTYTDVDSGESITTSSVGEGSDIGSDTATRKAATQAMKISHLHMFTIPNSEFDDEGYEPAGAAEAKGKAKADPPALKRAVSGGAKGGGTSLTKLRAEVKAAGAAKGIKTADLNKMGSAISPSFIDEPESLEALLTHIKDQ